MPILVESFPGYRRITLNRPERLNALNSALGQALLDALNGLAEDAAVRAVVLTGAGRGFCAGGDIDLLRKAREREDVTEVEALLKLGKQIILAIATMPKPVIAAVNGPAAGAGVNLALACTTRIASDHASFTQSFAKIGLFPDFGATYFLPRLVGTGRAMGLAMLAEKLTAEQAAQWGLIWQCVDDAELQPTVNGLLEHFASAPTLGLAATKRAIYAAAENSIEAQLGLERDLQRELGRSADYREGVAAFTAKRSPQFSGH